MYGTLGPERLVWDDEADEAMKETVKKNNQNKNGIFYSCMVLERRIDHV